jgi:hypothetical protein
MERCRRSRSQRRQLDEHVSGKRVQAPIHLGDCMRCNASARNRRDRLAKVGGPSAVGGGSGNRVAQSGSDTARHNSPNATRGVLDGRAPPWKNRPVTTSLAKERADLLGLPDGVDAYEQEDVWRVLAGGEVDPTIADVVYRKVALCSGVALTRHLNQRFPSEGWTSERFLVRTIAFGESTASLLVQGPGVKRRVRGCRDKTAACGGRAGAVGAAGVVRAGAQPYFGPRPSGWLRGRRHDV